MIDSRPRFTCDFCQKQDFGDRRDDAELLPPRWTRLILAPAKMPGRMTEQAEQFDVCDNPEHRHISLQTLIDKRDERLAIATGWESLERWREHEAIMERQQAEYGQKKKK